MMKSKNIFLLLLVAGMPVVISFLQAGKTIRNNKNESSISYHAKHSLHEWTAINKNIDCVIIYNEDSNLIEKVAVSGKVADFDSENSNRDSHAMEVLDNMHFPKITFSSKRIVSTGNKLQVDGTLTFHGVIKPISFIATRQDKGSIITVTGAFSVLLSEYDIERPSFMMMQMEDQTDITFVITFNPIATNH